MAVVESVRTVQIEGTKSPVGAVAGTVVGGIAGSNVVAARAVRSVPCWVRSPGALQAPPSKKA